MIRLSHTAANEYSICPKRYEFIYKEHLRSNKHGAALSFGKAIDAAISLALKGEPIEKAVDLFYDRWLQDEVHGEQMLLRQALPIVYGNSDFNNFFLSPNVRYPNYVKFITKKETLDKEFETDVLDYYNEVSQIKNEIGYDHLEENHRRFFNTMNWECLAIKGQLMIGTFYRDMLQKVGKVVDIQKKIELSNDEGDSVVGYVDVLSEFPDLGLVVGDIKTSAMRYDQDSIKTSQQLSLYASILDAQWAAYYVLLKTIIKDKVKICTKCEYDGSESRAKTCDNDIKGKRCHGEWSESFEPKTDYQIIIDKVSPTAKDLVLDNMIEITHAIRNEVFPRCLNQCANIYGKPCEFIKYCWEGKKEGLKYVKRS